MQTINAKPYRRSNHIADQTISQIKPYRRSNHIADQTISQIKPYRRSNHIADRDIIITIPLTVVCVVKYWMNLASSLNHMDRIKLGNQPDAILNLQPRNGVSQSIVYVRHDTCIFFEHFYYNRKKNKPIISIFLLI
jgi:hypothetical protein